MNSCTGTSVITIIMHLNQPQLCLSVWLCWLNLLIAATPAEQHRVLVCPQLATSMHSVSEGNADLIVDALMVWMLTSARCFVIPCSLQGELERLKQCRDSLCAHHRTARCDRGFAFCHSGD
jgi:hypothetical protein